MRPRVESQPGNLGLALYVHPEWRTLITLIAGVVAVYILLDQLSRVSLRALLSHSDWRWGVLAIGLSALTYAGATLELQGFVLERLNPVRTFLAQVAGSFVMLITPAAVGVAAPNIRFLRKAGVSAADAVSSVGVAQVVAFVVHAAMLLTFAALTGTSSRNSLLPPNWAWIALAVAVAGLLISAAVPAGRSFLRSWLKPLLSRAIPRLLDIAQQPMKLAEGGGAVPCC